MVKLGIGKLFQGRTPFEIEVNKARKDVWRQRESQLAPAFKPTDGGYEYHRYIELKNKPGKSKRYRHYKALLRVAFSPAPDFGWIISGVGNEWLSEDGDDIVKFIIADGRIVANGKFFWVEERRGGLEKMLVTGNLEPIYAVHNNCMVVDKEASFSAKYLKPASNGDVGTWNSLSKFRLRGGSEISIDRPLSRRQLMVLKAKQNHEIQEKFGVKKATTTGGPDESTEDPTDEDDYYTPGVDHTLETFS